jgi:hypothetical protein
MKKLLLLLLVCLSLMVHAHDARTWTREWSTWHLSNSNDELNASLLYGDDDSVTLMMPSEQLYKIAYSDLTEKDAELAATQVAHIQELNGQKPTATSRFQKKNLSTKGYILLAFIAMTLVAWLSRNQIKKKRNLIYLGTMLVLLASFTTRQLRDLLSITDPLVVDEAFQPFVPEIHTYFDDNYFYVESRGIPKTHEMMVGISNHGWQQQVPIPQCYIGTNAWPIPLNPALATDPIPVDSVHFTRGAIAIAVNGVPIFNVHTNTGVDSYLDGQLDNFGGHCGRADDYHYHIAPLHLYAYTQANLPIAYGLDGYAVYGSTEPDGSTMLPLDDNHGHLGTDGVYHYHGTASAPYMIARMAGVVTEDNTHQLIPQARATPVRPSLTPLNGALITACTPNATNYGYTLNYTLQGAQDSIVYSWDANGVYSFDYYTASGLVHNDYNGFVQCEVPTSISEVDAKAQSLISFPNPAAHSFVVQTPASWTNAKCNYEVYSSDGKKMLSGRLTNSTIDCSTWNKGCYILKLMHETEIRTTKVIVE